MSTPCPTVDPDGVPNLDAMEDLELLEFYKRHRYGWNCRDLFTQAVIYHPAKDATKQLSAYAWNLYLARIDRHDGKIQRAQEYEAVAQRVYEQLPSWARW